ncbi:MAG: FcoT family thioesterase, partial [Pseudonocardiaceae bacterium]
DDYWARQLPGFFIARFESAFRTPMRGRHFDGELKLRSVRQRKDKAGRRSMIWLDTACGYWEGSGGRCDGTVLVAISTEEGGACDGRRAGLDRPGAGVPQDTECGA